MPPSRGWPRSCSRGRGANPPRVTATGAPEGWTRTGDGDACPACSAGTGPVFDEGPCPRCHGICVLRGDPPERGQCVYCHYWMTQADYDLTDDGGTVAEVQSPDLPDPRVLAILLMRNNAESFRVQRALLEPLIEAIAAGGHHTSAGQLVLDSMVTELARWANQAISAGIDALPFLDLSYDEVWAKLLGDGADFSGLPGWLVPGSAEEGQADEELCGGCGAPDHCLTAGCLRDAVADRSATEQE